MRGGKLNDPNFKSRMRGDGIFAQQMAELFQIACKRRESINAGRSLRRSIFCGLQDHSSTSLRSKRPPV